MNREEMLKELTALDFYTLDLQLYLDTHPNDLKALEKYNAAAEEAGVLRREYEKNQRADVFFPVAKQTPVAMG